MSTEIQYVDKSGNPVKKGDILFYSESIPYAESLHVVVSAKGELWGCTAVGNANGEYFLVDRPKEPLVLLRHYTNGFDNILTDATVIGNEKENPDFLTVEYATKNYPLPKN